jgi:RNA polymerase sigma-70 factor (ECF subfamily)
VLRGDRAAYASLVKRYERAVYTAALAIVHDRHTAQDVAQDAFVLGFQKLGGLRDRGAFGGWIITIAKRCAVDQASRRRLKLVGLDDARGFPDPRADRGCQIDSDSKALLDAIARLPETEQRLLALRYFNDESLEAIAQMTGRSVGTVSKQIWRALQRLRRHLM